MPIINSTIFDGQLLIVGVNQASIDAALDAAIEQYETEYLDKAMGVSFATLFLNGVAGAGGAFGAGFGLGFNHGSVDMRWRKLRDGAIFTVGGTQVRWAGLTANIARYVYYWYRRNNASQIGQTGNETISQSENSYNTGTALPMVRAWNDMARNNGLLYNILTGATDSGELVYPEFANIGDANVYRKINPVL